MSKENIYDVASERVAASLLKRKKVLEQESKKERAIQDRLKGETKIYNYKSSELEEVTAPNGTVYLKPKEDSNEPEVLTPEEPLVNNIDALTVEDIDAIEDRKILYFICEQKKIEWSKVNTTKTLKARIIKALFPE